MLFFGFEQSTALVSSSISKNCSVPTITLSSTCRITMPDIDPPFLWKIRHGYTRDCTMLSAHTRWPKYVWCQCRLDSGIAYSGFITFNTEFGDSFISLDVRTYTSRSIGVTEWIYAWVISNICALGPSIDTARERMRRCVRCWTVGTFFLIEAAWSSP